MTEDQAKKKACPLCTIANCIFAQRVKGPAKLDNTCIASDCMMWVTDLEAQTVSCPGTGTAESVKKNLPAEGHCGLIGGRP